MFDNYHMCSFNSIHSIRLLFKISGQCIGYLFILGDNKYFFKGTVSLDRSPIQPSLKDLHLDLGLNKDSG